MRSVSPSSFFSSSGKFTVGLLLIGASDCEEVRELLQKEAYEFGVFPDVDNVVHATFPFKGSVSIPIAIRKVYPMLNDFIKVNTFFFSFHQSLYQRISSEITLIVLRLFTLPTPRVTIELQWSHSRVTVVVKLQARISVQNLHLYPSKPSSQRPGQLIVV